MQDAESWKKTNPYGTMAQPLASVDDFIRAIASESLSRINCALWEARQDPALFHSVLIRLAQIPRPPDACRHAFHAAWTNQGLWIRECFSIDPVLAPALANLLPGYDGPPMRLYRGERWSNHQNRTYGFSWTSERQVGEMFARGLNCPEDEGGVLLVTNAVGTAILARPNEHSRQIGEFEYIVDRRRLDQVEVVERYR